MEQSLYNFDRRKCVINILKRIHKYKQNKRMPMSETELLLEQMKVQSHSVSLEFAAVRKEIASNHETYLLLLQEIKSQTTKTNGRVTQLEFNVFDMSKREASHILNCPNVERIEALEKEGEDARFYKRHPKLTVMGLAITVIISILGIAYTLIQAHDLATTFMTSHTTTKTEQPLKK